MALKEQEQNITIGTYFCMDTFDDVVSKMLEDVAKLSHFDMTWEDKFSFSRKLAKMVPNLNHQLKDNKDIQKWELQVKNNETLVIKYIGVRE